MVDASMAPKVGDIVQYVHREHGTVHYGRAFEVTTRFGAFLVRPDHANAAFCEFVAIVERADDAVRVTQAPTARVPVCGDEIVYEQFHGGPHLRGKAMGVRLLLNGGVLVKPNRVDAPWCKFVEIVEDAR